MNFSTVNQSGKINFFAFSIAISLLWGMVVYDVSQSFAGKYNAVAYTVVSSSSTASSNSSSSAQSSNGVTTTNTTSSSNADSTSSIQTSGPQNTTPSTITTSGSASASGNGTAQAANNNTQTDSASATNAGATSQATITVGQTTSPYTAGAFSQGSASATSSASSDGINSTTAAETNASALALASSTNPAVIASASASASSTATASANGTGENSSSFSSATSSAFAEAVSTTTTPALSGTLTVCKMIVVNNVLKNDAAGLPAGNFSIQFQNEAGTPSFASTWSLTASAFNPDRAIISTSNDADCVTYSVPFGNYSYAPETVVGSWGTPAYTEDVNVSAISGFGSYGNGVNSDGHLTVDNAHVNATLLVLNSTSGSTPSQNHKPVITLIGSSTVIISVNSNYIDLGATAFDQEDGDITSSIVVTGSVATGTVGTYTITYNVTDSQGLAADPVTRTVIVQSGSSVNHKPVITLIGSSTISILAGTNFVDPGATAFDQEDGNITANIIATGTVATTTPGTYTITYNVTDSQGLAADSVTRTIIVVPTSCQPIITNNDFSVSTRVNQPFSYQISVVNNSTSTLQYSVTNLPAGLSFSSSTATISGTPTAVGTFAIGITVSTSCGSDSKTLSLAVTRGGSSGGGGHSGGSSRLTITNEKVVELIPGIALVTWDTNRDATGQVVYGTHSTSSDVAPLFGYTNSTITLTLATSTHSMVVIGLQPNTTYYFRPYSTAGSLSALGEELVLNPGEITQTCNYLLEYIKLGANNNPTEVRKLQIFLRDLMGYTNVPVTGFYDQVTYNAVKDFQVKNNTDILKPWGYTGNDGTGYVYILTKKKVNEIYCEKAFPLNTQQEAEIAAFRKFMETLGQQGIEVPTGTTNTPAPVINEPTEGEQNSGIQEGEIGMNTTSTSTASTTVPGLLGRNLRNVAAALFALPTTFSGSMICIVSIIVALLVIYIIATVIDRTNNMNLSDRIRRGRRLIYMIIGLVVGIILAVLFNLTCVILPLIVIAVILAVVLLVLKIRDGVAEVE